LFIAFLAENSLRAAQDFLLARSMLWENFLAKKRFAEARKEVVGRFF